MPSHVMDEDPEAPRPTQISIHEEQVAFEEQVEELDAARPLDYKEYEFDPNSLDIVGSPRLTKLFGFLTIEECDDIDDLDLTGSDLEIGDIWSQDLLDICNRSDRRGEEEDALGNELSTSTSGIPGTSLPGTLKTSRIIRSLEIWTKKWFQYEVYPFPTSQSCARFPYDFSGIMFSSRGSSQPKMSPSQCKRRLRTLKSLEHVEIIHLLEAMGLLADELYHDSHYVEAEIWFRRIVTTKRVKQLIAWHNPQQTLLASACIITCMFKQGRITEAHQLHDNFHDKLERVLGVDHDITCLSRQLKGYLLRQLGFEEEEEGLFRQHLQICLTTLGTAHPRTAKALQELGRSLGKLKRHTESQRLLETTIHFQLQKAKVLGEIGNNKADILLSMTYLAQGLNRDMKYDEGEAVLDCAQKLLGDATRTKCETGFKYHYTRASSYILQKRLDESEKIVRSLLRYHEKSLLPINKGNFMWKLAEILMETDRESGAAYWFKKIYILDAEAFDPVHAYTMDSCWRAGFCYAQQGRYDEARLFFGNAIETLSSSTAGDNSRLKCIQEINVWMLEVEEMRAEDPMPRGSVAEDSERMDFDIDSDDYWREIGDIPDLCPLQDL
jgi:tetratricopeptide (TPR) repeat protein